jgi:hypothetical protein
MKLFLLGLVVAIAGTKAACIGDACAAMAALQAKCTGADFGSGAKAWNGVSGNPCLTQLSEDEARAVALANGLTIGVPFAKASATKGLYKVDTQAFFGTGGTDEQERATPSDPATESRVNTLGKYTWQGIKCNVGLQVVEM